MRQRLDALEVAALFEILDDCLAGFHRRHAGAIGRTHGLSAY